MKKVLNIAMIALTVSITLLACKKDKSTTVTSCFSDSYNGTYSGSLVSGGVPSQTTVKITKTSCTTATLESPGITTINIKSLNASSGGGYNGTTESNESISLSLDNNAIQVAGAIAFNGSK